MNFNQIKNYKLGLFTFFIWYNNFKDCSENISFQIDRVLKKSTRKDSLLWSDTILEKANNDNFYHPKINIYK